MLNNPFGEVAFSLFNIPVYFYGIIMALSVFVGGGVAYFLYKKFIDSKNADLILDFMPFIIILGVLGARLYYCLVNFSYYAQRPLEILNIRQGGLSIHGMIFVGTLTLIMFARIYKLSFLHIFDCFACGTILAQSIGRWGNFFNYEAFGFPTDLPWKLFIPVSHRPLQYINYEYFHPTFLYESILNLLIFFILFCFFKKLTKVPGRVACLYLIFYSFVRIFVEYFRIDSVLSIAGFPVAQVVSVFTVIFASIFLYTLNSQNQI